MEFTPTEKSNLALMIFIFGFVVLIIVTQYIRRRTEKKNPIK